MPNVAVYYTDNLLNQALSNEIHWLLNVVEMRLVTIHEAGKNEAVKFTVCNLLQYADNE